MGIDKIGKNNGLPDVSGPSGTETSAPVDRTFAEVHADKTGRTEGAAQAQATAGASPLDKLRAGEIDVNGYVDARIEQATSGLKGLTEKQLGSIRSVLREQMMTDPSLADLVQQATGRRAQPPEE